MASQRIMRAFTLARTTSELLDGLLNEGAERLRILLPTDTDPTQPTSLLLDDCGLLPEDYVPLYAMLPKKTNPYVPRDLTSQSFLLHFNYGAAPSDVVLRAMNRRIAERRKEAKKLSKKPSTTSNRVNVSRIADALIVLGLSALQERVTASESVEGSSRSNAKEGRNKLPVSSGSKVLTVRTLRGGPRP